MKDGLSGIVILLFLLPLACFSKENAESFTTDKVINFPSKLFSRIQGKTANLDKQLTAQTDKYLAKMARREERNHSVDDISERIKRTRIFAS